MGRSIKVYTLQHTLQRTLQPTLQHTLQHELQHTHATLGPFIRHVRIYICTYVRLVCSMKLCTLQQTLKIAKTHINCSTNCIAHCNTNCNTHCNTNCNTHWNARKPFSDAPSKYLRTCVYQLRRSIKTLTLQHTLQRTLQHTLQHTLQCT